jgi:voltage-gated potassium channel
VRRLTHLGFAIVALLVFGTVAFALSEHGSVWYGFRETVNTAATVGSISPPHHLAGEIVQVVVIILGVGTLFYALASVTEFFVAGHLGELLAQRRMQKMIDSLTDHHITCGFGRVGRQVARDLHAANAKYVIVDSTPGNRELALAQTVGVRFIEGDASDDQVLLSAGITRARSLLACADSDAENIFITLTARELCPGIAIVARASVEDSEKKLLRAGANRVISPYKSSGTEMARLALHPQVSGVVDVDAEYRLEEISVELGAAGVNMTVGDVRGGAIIVGVRLADGSFNPQPPAEAVLHPGDVLMAIGTPRTLERLERLFAVGDRAATPAS